MTRAPGRRPPPASPRRTLTAAAPALLVAAAGCSSEPETPPPLARRGRPVDHLGAYYDLAIDGDRAGHLKVWTRGLEPVDEANGGPPWRVHLGLRVCNDGPSPLELEAAATQLEVHLDRTRDAHLVLAEPAALDGEPTVPPGAIRRLALLFDLPAGVADPGAVVGLELSWAAGTPGGRISESTRFRRARRPDLEPAERGWVFAPWGRPPARRDVSPARRAPVSPPAASRRGGPSGAR